MKGMNDAQKITQFIHTNKIIYCHYKKFQLTPNQIRICFHYKNSNYSKSNPHMVLFLFRPNFGQRTLV